MEEALYYIFVQGEQQGPFSLSQLSQSGLQPSTMVWRQGLENWVEASSLPELNHLFQQSYPYDRQTPPYGHQTPPYGQPNAPYGQPTAPYGQTASQYGQPAGYYRVPGTLPPGWTNWQAWAIVATVLGVVMCGLIGSIFGIVGIVKANTANEAARMGDPNADRLNSQAKTWTIVSFCVSGAIVVIFAVFFFLVSVFSY